MPLQGVVERVVDTFVGEIAMLGSGDVVRVDQAQLETVIPQVQAGRGALVQEGTAHMHGGGQFCAGASNP